MSELEIKKITKKYFTKAILMLFVFLLGMAAIEFFLAIYYGNPSNHSGFSLCTTALPIVMLLIFFDAVQKVLVDIHEQKSKQPE